MLTMNLIGNSRKIWFNISCAAAKLQNKIGTAERPDGCRGGATHSYTYLRSVSGKKRKENRPKTLCARHVRVYC